MSHNNNSPYLNTEQLARRWLVSPRTLERWRYEGTKPDYYRLNGRVLYHIDDIMALEAMGHRQCHKSPDSSEITLPCP